MCTPSTRRFIVPLAAAFQQENLKAGGFCKFLSLPRNTCFTKFELCLGSVFGPNDSPKPLFKKIVQVKKTCVTLFAGEEIGQACSVHILSLLRGLLFQDQQTENLFGSASNIRAAITWPEHFTFSQKWFPQDSQRCRVPFFLFVGAEERRAKMQPSCLDKE